MAAEDEAHKREKGKDISALRDLFPFFRPYRLTLILAITALVCTAAVSLVLPIAARRVVDGFGQEITLLDQYFSAAIGLAALFALGSALRFYLVTRLGERVVADIRKAVYERVIYMSRVFFETVQTGEVVSRITTDTTLIQAVIGSSISFALRNMLLLIGGLIMMLLTSPKLTGMVLLIVPVVIGPILILGRRVRTFSRTTQDKISQSSGHAAEALHSVETVQVFAQEPRSVGQFSALTEDAFEAAKNRIGARAALTFIVIFLVFSGIVCVLWLGARDVQNEVLSSGTLVQFLIYAIMVGGAVAAFSELWAEIQRAAGATERLTELLRSEDEIKDPETPKTLEHVRGEIVFDNVHFAYPSRPNSPILEGFNITIKPGEMVAFVGPSGAGKTTIFQLLLRFFEPQQGRVLIDGKDIADLNRREFRSHISVVPQDPAIFADTARENIRFGLPEASEDRVVAAAKAADAHEFVSALPDGYNSLVGENGILLSGGQRQRLAIARAVLRNDPILVLDEATSALDAQSERAIQNAVEALSKTRTTLVVAHRLSTVLRADRIVVIDEGRIVNEGTHQELLAAGGLYADLVKLQLLALDG